MVDRHSGQAILIEGIHPAPRAVPGQLVLDGARDGARAAPGTKVQVEPEALLRELLGEAGQTSAAAAGVDSLRHRLVTSAACQAAIKIHHPLTLAGMQGLLDDLYRTDSPSTCPHGRPVLFRLTLSSVTKSMRWKMS